MLTSGYSSWIGLTFYFAALSLGLAQETATVASPQLTLAQPVSAQAATPSQAFQATLSTFLTGQRKLAQQMDALMAQGATAAQLDAWRQQNAAAIQAQQKLAISLAAATPPQPIPYITDVTLPEGATQEMTDFLTTRADLANRFAQWHNQQIQGSSSAADTMAAFQQQNAAELQAQQQRAQVLAAQSAAQPMPVPAPLVIPPGSTPQLKAFLTLRDQLMRDEIALRNANLSSTPAVRAAALQQWHQQNAARFQQLQQLAQNLSSSTSNQVSNPESP